MELYLLDDRAQRIAMVPEYESLNWRTGLITSTADLKAPVGCFFNFTQARYLERSDTDTILFINSRGVSENGGERGCHLSAYDPVELLRRRVLFRTHDFARSRAEVIRRLVSAGLADVRDLPGKDRQIPLLEDSIHNARVENVLNQQLTCQMSWGTIYEHIESILEGLPVRFFSCFDPDVANPIVPTLYEGRDLTQDVVLSAQYGDLFDIEYSFESADRNNLAVVTRQGEDVAKLVEPAVLDISVEHGELWVDADDIGDDPGDGSERLLTVSEVRERLRARGIEKLQEQPCEHALTASINQDRFQYGTDYQVGDRISYEAFGVEHSDVISEVEEVFEGQSSRINITIGTTYPTIRQIVERNKK